MIEIQLKVAGKKVASRKKKMHWLIKPGNSRYKDIGQIARTQMVSSCVSKSAVNASPPEQWG